MHELLERRHSPYVFAAERDVSVDDVRGLLEAARWTMSSYNEQPWRYVVGSRSRSPEVWQAVLEVLVPGNRGWARHAPIPDARSHQHTLQPKRQTEQRLPRTISAPPRHASRSRPRRGASACIR